jgi:DNA-binding transcriptional LysR family regulator
MTIPALEGFHYFAQVAEHGGYARAGRALAIPKSRLSRHVSALEEALGVRLVNRSTRRFVVTEVGQEVLRHAQAMLLQAEAAVEAAEFARAAPRGLLRVACSVAIAQTGIARILPDFLAAHPAVRVQLAVSNRRVDVLAEGFDAAIRVRSRPTGEDGLVMRSFGPLCELLVASPDYLARKGAPESPQDLARLDALAFSGEGDRFIWELHGPNDATAHVELTPRLVCHEFVVLHEAALAGRGVALLPQIIGQESLDAGRLVRVLPAWRLPEGICHVVFPSRRGMLPAVRALIDFLAARLPPALHITREPAR